MSDYGPAFDALSRLVRSAGRCERCKRRFHPSKLDAHHTIPRKAGGPDTYGNLEPLCDQCHAIRERETREAVLRLTRVRPRRLKRVAPPPTVADRLRYYDPS
jgi:5-methylcytosine-specific restriction endonuclease McrA